MGIDPEQLLKAQEVGKDVKGVIRVNYTESFVQLSFSSDTTGGKELIPELLEQFSIALAQQLSSVFGIKGEIIETGEKKVH